MSIIEQGRLDSSQLSESNLKDLLETLSSLGYEDLEIRRAIRAVIKDSEKTSCNTPENSVSLNNAEALLKATLLLLTQEAA